MSTSSSDSGSMINLAVIGLSAKSNDHETAHTDFDLIQRLTHDQR